MIPLGFWEGVATGVGLSVLAIGVAWWLLARSAASRRSVPRSERSASPRVGALNGPVTVDPPDGGTSGTPSAPADPIDPPVAGRSVDTVSDRLAGPTSRSNGGAGTGSDLRLSSRVILHVARQGVVPAGPVAPKSLSQAGMVEQLGVQQGALTGVLRRLVAAGVLTEDRAHVAGVDRRVKVYRLSPRGEQLARSLRSSRPREPAPGLS